jgi:hypothetical protein
MSAAGLGLLQEGKLLQGGGQLHEALILYRRALVALDGSRPKLQLRVEKLEREIAASVGQPPPPRILVLSVFHGLGNRLRTVAAGAALAASLDRELHLHWPVNQACLASWDKLFAAPAMQVNTPECHADPPGVNMPSCPPPPSGYWSNYEPPRDAADETLDRAALAGLATDPARVVRLHCKSGAAPINIYTTDAAIPARHAGRSMCRGPFS